MQIKEYLHIAILVSDLERAEHFYSNILGLPKVDRSLNFPGTWYQIGNFQIHLIEDTNIKPQLHNSGKLGRNRHIAFSVTNLEEAKSQLIEHGCEVQMSASGRAALFTIDPDGNVIELNLG